MYQSKNQNKDIQRDHEEIKGDYRWSDSLRDTPQRAESTVAEMCKTIAERAISALTDARPGANAAGLLALEDANASGSESEPEVDGLGGGSAPKAKAKAKASSTSVAARKGITFRPFKFFYESKIIKSGPRKGDTQQWWRAECPYHHDDDDADATTCKCAIQFVTAAEESNAIKVLKHWCVLGYKCQCRTGKHGHKGLQIDEGALMSDAQLTKLLKHRLAQPIWIADDDSDSSDASSSDLFGDIVS